MVFVTHNRLPLFDEEIAIKLFSYLLGVGKKHQFVIDRVGVLPDHLHIIFEGVPSVSVMDYALAIMNNTRYWMTEKYSGVLKETDGWDVWRTLVLRRHSGRVFHSTSGELLSEKLRLHLLKQVVSNRQSATVPRAKLRLHAAKAAWYRVINYVRELARS